MLTLSGIGIFILWLCVYSLCHSHNTLDNFCVYTREYEAPAEEELVCYLESYPVISDDDEEVYPDFVVENSLELFFYGEQFIDVLHNISIQREKPSVEDFISGLNFYLENDNFIEL